MKSKKNDDLEPTSGLGGFIHIITWPVRRFYIVIPLLALLLATPLFFGVKVVEMPSWYKEKIVMIWDKTPETFLNAINKAKTAVGLEEDDLWRIGKKDKKVLEGLAEAPKRKTSATQRRSGFNVSDKDIPRIEVKVEGRSITETVYTDDTENVIDNVYETKPKEKVLPQKNEELMKHFVDKKNRKLQLRYIDVPINIFGKAVIKNANEIEVEGTYIVLYGIYSKPNTYQNAQARAFLETKARKNDISCYIVAYTMQDVATGICFAAGENLNKSLVAKKYSQDIALPK